uniref:Neural cell adhesion molecule L1 n=1 Tax=Petromyzon marinus TaxID=7757 RepID=A0AAJ7X703_PETMA|nr:neuronal cell adhesion molecule-like isoform X3 [Petromyzon marinus]
MLPWRRRTLLAGAALLATLWVTSDSIDIPIDPTLLENVEQPPAITKQSPTDHYVDPLEDILVKCEAKGTPAPSYRWTKNDKSFDPRAEVGVVTAAGSGSFTFVKNSTGHAKRHEGDYQCLVSNKLGTAVSDKIKLRIASTPKWPKEVLDPMEVDEGNSVVLPCKPPQGVPPPKILWMTSTLDHIGQDKRVSQGLSGDLYFSNVKPVDSRDDYICYAQFVASRTIISKEPIKLKVRSLETLDDAQSSSVNETQLAVAGGLRNRLPSLLTPHGKTTRMHSLKGSTLVMECIAEGLPTPDVRWERVSGHMPRGRFSTGNHNKTLRLHPVEVEDSGQYKCIASNNMGSAHHSFVVTVDAAPYWTARPEDRIVAPGDDAVLHCVAGGKPPPETHWLLNGKPLNEAPAEPHRTVKGDRIVLKKLVIGQSAVYQCVASNVFGTIIANALVSVLAVPPKFITKDKEEYVVVEKQPVLLDCKVFGSPKPAIRWSKDGQVNTLQDKKFKEFENGSLYIHEAKKADQGLYMCEATNDLDTGTINAKLRVREATHIEPFERLRVRKDGTVELECRVTHDPDLELNIYWEKDGMELSGTNWFMTDKNTLTINNVSEVDQGIYICVAHTFLDLARAEAELTVIDKPDPPYNLKLSHHEERGIRLSWTPGNHYNSPISEYVVEYEEDRYKPGDWQHLANIKGSDTSAELMLRPYVNYQFQVIAYNEVGPSRASLSSQRYSTPPAVPDIAPVGVTGEGSEPDNMVIAWEPLKHLDRNGPNLRYKVNWRRKGTGEPWEEAILGADASRLLVNDTATFVPYEVKVQAINDLGEGPEPMAIVGHSGEDFPKSAPKNVKFVVVNSTVLKLTWDPIPVHDVRGHLKGYKVFYRKLRGLQERRRRHVEWRVLVFPGDRSHAVVPGLEPFSLYELEVKAFNGKGDGPASHALRVEMPEGVPGQVTNLRVPEKDFDSITLTWDPPAHPNGILTGYTVQYQNINNTQNLGTLHRVELFANVSELRVEYLDSYTKYKFYIAAFTSVGTGKILTEEAVTILEIPPAAPVLLSMNTTRGDTYANISWVPGVGQSASEYLIQFRDKHGPGGWRNHSVVSSSRNHLLLDGLSPGSQYQIRVVAFNEHGHTISSEDVIETTGRGYRRGPLDVATQAWFIALMCAVVLLIMILLIICFIKRNKGGKYSVKDKEDARVDPEAKPIKEETFGEYRTLESDNDEKPLAGSQPSLDGEVKRGESEDSLAEYGEGVEGQFNEDGSFIGQYGGSKEKVTGSEATSPVTDGTTVA